MKLVEWWDRQRDGVRIGLPWLLVLIVVTTAYRWWWLIF